MNWNGVLGTGFECYEVRNPFNDKSRSKTFSENIHSKYYYSNLSKKSVLCSTSFLKSSNETWNIMQNVMLAIQLFKCWVWGRERELWIMFRNKTLMNWFVWFHHLHHLIFHRNGRCDALYCFPLFKSSECSFMFAIGILFIVSFK